MHYPAWHSILSEYAFDISRWLSKTQSSHLQKRPEISIKEPEKCWPAARSSVASQVRNLLVKYQESRCITQDGIPF